MLYLGEGEKCHDTGESNGRVMRLQTVEQVTSALVTKEERRVSE